MVFHLNAAPVENALQRNTGPAGAIGKFVAQFMQCFLQFEQAQQSRACLYCAGSVEFRAARRLIVGGEKRTAHFDLSGARQGRQPRGFGVDVRNLAQGAVLHAAERVQHRGDVPQR